jgi:hypothetical protein
MDELFAVDAEARRKALTTAERYIRRRETARPLLDDIRGKIETARSLALPLQRAQQGLPVRANALEKAHPILGVSRTRAKY